MLGELRGSWCPRAVIVSFKLETDEGVLDEKASASLRNYHQDMVICNLLSSYRDRVTIKFESGEQKEVVNKQGCHIEELFVPVIIEYHSNKLKQV
jgi:phosphopantothenate-cysteine ligase